MQRSASYQKIIMCNTNCISLCAVCRPGNYEVGVPQSSNPAAIVGSKRRQLALHGAASALNVLETHAARV